MEKKHYKRCYEVEAVQVGEPADFPGVYLRRVLTVEPGFSPEEGGLYSIEEEQWVIDTSPHGVHIWYPIQEGDWVVTSLDGSTNIRRVYSNEDFGRQYAGAD